MTPAQTAARIGELRRVVTSAQDEITTLVETLPLKKTVIIEGVPHMISRKNGKRYLRAVLSPETLEEMRSAEPPAPVTPKSTAQRAISRKSGKRRKS